MSDRKVEIPFQSKKISSPAKIALLCSSFQKSMLKLELHRIQVTAESAVDIHDVSTKRFV